MAVKLSSRQQAQLAYLQTLPPKFQRIHAVIEEMATLRADDVVVRGLARLLDEIKGNAGSLSLTGMADTAGLMADDDTPRRGAADEGAGPARAAGKSQDQLRGRHALGDYPGSPDSE